MEITKLTADKIAKKLLEGDRLISVKNIIPCVLQSYNVKQVGSTLNAVVMCEVYENESVNALSQLDVNKKYAIVEIDDV